jgi:hypothetical protein
VTDQPVKQVPEAQGPDQDLRAARNHVREAGDILRRALAAHDELAAGGIQGNESER